MHLCIKALARNEAVCEVYVKLYRSYVEILAEHSKHY